MQVFMAYKSVKRLIRQYIPIGADDEDGVSDLCSHPLQTEVGERFRKLLAYRIGKTHYRISISFPKLKCLTVERLHFLPVQQGQFVQNLAGVPVIGVRCG